MDTFEQWLTDYGPAMSRLAATYLPPGPAREDLKQEIALALYRGYQSFRGESSPRTYIYKIAHHCALRALATDRRLMEVPLEPAHERSPALGPDPQAELLLSERRERLERALRQLPLGLRQPMMLRLEGLSYKEIEQILGVEVSALNGRIHRATEALKAMMEQER